MTMPWHTQVDYKFKNARGDLIAGRFEHVSLYGFPELPDKSIEVFKILERETHELVYELLDLSTRGIRTGFKAELKAKGWKMKDVAERWGISPRQVSNIAKSPKDRDWDMLDGLPDYRAA
jgi:hypothetical protein